MNKQFLRRLERLEHILRPPALYTLAWQDAGKLIQTSRAPPGAGARPRRIRYDRFPSQRIFDEITTMVKGFSGPIGSGKSKALCQEAIKCAYLNPGVEGLIGAPTERLLIDSTVVELLNTLDRQRIPYRYFRSLQKIHLTEPDSTILLRTLDNPERLRAMNLGWFGIDELTYCKEESWLRLEGRLRHPRAAHKQAFAVWTPKGKDWVFRRFISARKIANYEAVIAQPFENLAVLKAAPEYYRNLQRSYDEKFYRQEVLGEYVDLNSGTVYRAFTRENMRGGVYDPAKPLIVTMDFNVNPMSGLLLQETKLGWITEVQVLQEIVLQDSHVIEWCTELVRRTADWAGGTPDGLLHLRFYGDAAGNQHQANSLGESSWELVRRFFHSQQRYRAKFLYGTRNPPVNDRVNAANAMLRSFGQGYKQAGQRYVFIDPSCTELATDLEEVIWKVDNHGNTLHVLDHKDPRRTHASDALGYYLYEEFGFQNRGGATKQTF